MSARVFSILASRFCELSDSSFFPRRTSFAKACLKPEVAVPFHSSVLDSESEEEFCEQDEEVGGVEPDHPRHHGVELRSREYLGGSELLTDVGSYRKKCHEQQDNGREKRESTDGLELLDSYPIEQA